MSASKRAIEAVAVGDAVCVKIGPHGPDGVGLILQGGGVIEHVPGKQEILGGEG